MDPTTQSGILLNSSRSPNRNLVLRSSVIIAELMTQRFWSAPNATELSEYLDLDLGEIGPHTVSLTQHWKFHDVEPNFRCKVTYYFSYDKETWTLGGDLGASFWAAAPGRTTNKVEAAVTDATTLGRYLRFRFHHKSSVAAETYANISSAVAVRLYGQ